MDAYMHMSDKKPTGTTVGYIRLQKPQGNTVQVVDFTRFELTSHLIRFREENWISSATGFAQCSKGRNTDDFFDKKFADEFLVSWITAKTTDGYSILSVGGTPGPIPETFLNSVPQRAS